MAGLVRRQYLGERLVYAKLLGDGFGRALGIARQHDDPYPRLLERRDGLRRVFS
jgi:hypothetical protein